MNKIIKYFLILYVCFITGNMNNAKASKTYKPTVPVEKINNSLSSVEKKVRSAAVKVVTDRGHGSGTAIRYKDLNLILTAKHVTDGEIGTEYDIVQNLEKTKAKLIYQSKNHDIAVLIVKSDLKEIKPMSWDPATKYNIGTDIVYSGHPSWHKLMSFNGRIVGYEEVQGAGTQLIVNTYGWFGCSGSGVYNTDGELVGILYGVDVQYNYGIQIQENMIWVAPIKNINIDTALDAFCRGSVKNYKACK